MERETCAAAAAAATQAAAAAAAAAPAAADQQDWESASTPGDRSSMIEQDRSPIMMIISSMIESDRSPIMMKAGPPTDSTLDRS
jgi:hypothetical protein